MLSYCSMLTAIKSIEWKIWLGLKSLAPAQFLGSAWARLELGLVLAWARLGLSLGSARARLELGLGLALGQIGLSSSTD